MARARVLIVDDSVVVRRLLRDIIGQDASLVVQAAASNGRLALAQIRDTVPDVVVLDIEMPEMDGLATLVEIRRLHPRLPVIMFSSLTARGAEATIDSLTRGASDYVTKPAHSSGLEDASHSIRQQLLPKIRALCAGVLGAPGAAREQRPQLQALPVRHTAAGLRALTRILAIGSSTGGPNALAEVICGLPEDFPVPVIITQHMPAMFTRFLAERLNSGSRLRVAEAAGGEDLEAGRVWIAPGDFHMVVRAQGDRVRLAIHQEPPENSCRPSVDVMFRSVAEVYGPAALGLILTGMGHDGLAGASSLVESGSRVLAQDEATSVVWGMPGYVARAGLAEGVYPLGQLATEIVSMVLPSRARGERVCPA